MKNSNCVTLEAEATAEPCSEADAHEGRQHAVDGHAPFIKRNCAEQDGKYHQLGSSF